MQEPGEESKVKSQHVGLSFRLSRERNKRLNVSTIWMKMNVIVLTSLVWSLSWGPHYSFSKEERVVWSGFSWKRIIMPDHDNNSFSLIENEYWLKVIFLWANIKKKWKQKCADFLFFSLLVSAHWLLFSSFLLAQEYKISVCRLTLCSFLFMSRHEDGDPWANEEEIVTSVTDHWLII
jgi:hypothetical protein